MAFSDLYTAVEGVSSSQITAAQAKTAVNNAYNAILRMRPWLSLRKSTWFTTAADKTAGTVTVTLGSTTVTGVGTAFASTDAGRYLVIGSRQPMRISAYVSATSLTLASAWNEPTITGTAYSVMSLRYALPADAERVLRLLGPSWPILRRSLELVDYYDPLRANRGTPLIYDEAEYPNDPTVTPQQSREIELWPVPNQTDTLYLQYRVKPTNLSADADIPVVNPEAIQWLAMADMSQTLFNRTGDQTFLATSKQYRENFQIMLDAMIREDRRMRGSHPQVMDSEDVANMNDPSFLAMWRQFQVLGLGSIA